MINKNIVLCFLFIQTLLYSQFSSSSFDVPISISITNGLVINKVSGDLDFGEVLSTGNIQTLTKDPEFGVLFEVSGNARDRISIDYSKNVALDNSIWVGVNGGNLGNINFLPNVRHTGKRSTYTNSRNLRNGRRIRLRNDNGIGKLFIWLGGSLDIKANQEAGSYVGTFNITVAY